MWGIKSSEQSHGRFSAQSNSDISFLKQMECRARHEVAENFKFIYLYMQLYIVTNKYYTKMNTFEAVGFFMTCITNKWLLYKVNWDGE